MKWVSPKYWHLKLLFQLTYVHMYMRVPWHEPTHTFLGMGWHFFLLTHLITVEIIYVSFEYISELHPATCRLQSRLGFPLFSHTEWFSSWNSSWTRYERRTLEWAGCLDSAKIGFRGFKFGVIPKCSWYNLFPECSLNAYIILKKETQMEHFAKRIPSMVILGRKINKIDCKGSIVVRQS